MLRVYSVYDAKAEAYLAPFFAPTRGVALRMFMGAIADPNSQFSKYAADYTLFEIGEFDEFHGSLDGAQAKVSLGCALEFVGKANGSV